jgi:hypothetical protein
MQDPFPSFLGEDPVPASMSPDASGMQVSTATGLPWSPQDSVQVQATEPLAVQQESAPAAVIEAPPETNKLKVVAGIAVAGALAYWLFKGKPARINPRRRRH